MKNVRTRVISGATLIRALAAVATVVATIGAPVVATTAGLFTSGSALAADSSERTMAGQAAADKSIIDMFGGVAEDEESFIQRKEQESREKRTAEMKQVQDAIAAKGGLRRVFAHYKVDRQVAQDVAQAKQGPEYQKMKLGEAVKGRFSSLRGTQAYKGMNEDEQSNSVVKLIAEEAAKMNMPGIASKAAAQYVATQRKAQKAKDEQYKLGVQKQKDPLDVGQLQRNVGKDAIAKRKANSHKARSDEAMDVGVLKKDVYIGGVNQGAGGIMQPDGSLILNGQRVPPGKWNLTPPVAGAGGRAPSKADLVEEIQKLFTNKDLGEYRDEQRNTHDELNAYKAILKTVEKSYDKDNNINILGAAGSLTRFGGNLVESVKALVRVGGGDWDNTWLNLSAEEQEAKIADAGPEVAAYADNAGRDARRLPGVSWFDRVLNVTDNRKKFNAQMIVAAYALARTWKPEGGKIANFDYIFALQTLAGTATNPQILVDILMARARTAHQRLQTTIDIVGDEYWEVIVGPRSRQSYAKDYKDTEDTYDNKSTHVGRKQFTFEDGIQYPNSAGYVDPNIARWRAARWRAARIRAAIGGTP